MSTGNAQQAYDEPAVFAVMADVISLVCGIDRATLRPESRVRDLEIDSLFAGEIMARTERTLQIDIDFRKVSDDWADLTLADLAVQFWSGTAAAHREPAT